MRYTAFLLILAGIAMGTVGTLLLLPDVDPVNASTVVRAPAASDEITRLREALNAREIALAREMTRAANLEQTVRQLREQLAMQPGLEDEDEPEDLAYGDRNEFLRDRMISRMQRMSDRQLDEIVRVAELTPDQITAVQFILQERFDRRAEVAAARMRGEEIEFSGGPSLAEQLSEVMTPEQFDAYQEYQAAVQQSRVETGATAQMNAIAPQLGLTDAQKDAVYALFYQNLEMQMNEDAPPADDLEGFLHEQMQSVLTPEQFVQWQEVNARRSGRGSSPDRR